MSKKSKIFVYLAHIVMITMLILSLMKVYNDEENAWFNLIGWLSATVWANMSLSLLGILNRRDDKSDES